jgi:hypothetical protein
MRSYVPASSALSQILVVGAESQLSPDKHQIKLKTVFRRLLKIPSKTK